MHEYPARTVHRGNQGVFKCLKCSYVFTHQWTGGNPDPNVNPNARLVFAATECKKCGNAYVKRIEDA